MLKIVCFVGLILLAIHCNPCEPLGLRIYYGKILVDPSSTEKAVVYFNTQERCSSSFVKVAGKRGVKAIECQHKEIEASEEMNYYKAYIHTCPLTNIHFEETFSYAVFGQDKNEDTPTMNKEYWIDVKLADTTKEDREMKVVVFADWGDIKQNLDIMTPITDYLKRTIYQKEINVVIINGDIAYDLSSNNGTNYQIFLQLLGEFASKIPFIHVPGNHQHKTNDDLLLFSESFQSYGVQQSLAAGLHFGNLFLVPYDPYNMVYNIISQQSSFDRLQQQLIIGQKSNRFILPLSHYPLICGAQAEECQTNFQVLKDYYNLMIDHGVSLFVAAHTHSYQRNYPYFRDQTFQQIDSPYNGNGSYLISIVQGVAGNDVEISTEMPVVKSHTAMYTINETGFGIIQSNRNLISYTHFSTKQGPMDKIIILKTEIKSNFNLNNLKRHD